jgi:hypothetical protein
MGTPDPHRGAPVAEPLTPRPDPEAAQRLSAAAALTQSSTHYLRGQLHTILGFAELLQEEDAERGAEDAFGALLSHAARRLQARIDALLYVLATADRPQAPHRPEALGGLVQDLSVGRGIPIDCRFPGHRPVAVDVHGLRCLLQEIAVLRDPPPDITLAIATGPDGADEWLEVTCTDASGSPDPAPVAPPTATERPQGLAVLAAVAAALGGTVTEHESPAGARDLRVAILLPATNQPIAGEAGV